MSSFSEYHKEEERSLVYDSVIIKEGEVLTPHVYYEGLLYILTKHIPKYIFKRYGVELCCLVFGMIPSLTPTVTIITTLYNIWKRYRSIKDLIDDVRQDTLNKYTHSI